MEKWKTLWWVIFTLENGAVDYTTVRAFSKRDAIERVLDAHPEAVRAAVLRHD